MSILILAAGGSSRMSAVKQLLPWKDSSLLEHAIQNARNTRADKIGLVLGAYKEQILDKIDTHGLLVFENEDWAAGLGASLSNGVLNLVSQFNPDGILIMLADQPLIDTGYLDSLIQAFQSGGKSIVGTHYSPNKIGVPAIFGKAYFEDLCRLENDEGAGSVIAKNTSDAIGLDPGGKEADIDTLEDYNELFKQFGN